MKLNMKKRAVMFFLIGNIAGVNASICNMLPGRVTCGHGAVDSLSGNGMVTVSGTTVLRATLINGMLNADEATFFSLEVNGNATLTQCTINDLASVKGSLVASSTKFEKRLEVFSSETRLVNSKINSDLHLAHTDSKKQVVYLDNSSEVSGDIIFDDGKGEVIVRGQSKIGGKVIGGHTVSK